MTSTCLTAPTTSKYIAAIVIGLISRVPHTFAGFECVGSRVGQATWTPTHSKSRNEWGTRLMTHQQATGAGRATQASPRCAGGSVRAQRTAHLAGAVL